MKRIHWMALLGLVLSLMFCALAYAQTTGIAVDGKVYTFAGSEGTYEADGKTFIIGADAVTIKEDGKPDRVLGLIRSSENEAYSLVENEPASFIEQKIEEAPPVVTEYYETSIVEDSQHTYSFEYAAPNPARFDAYAKFGLSYDAANDALYYQGKRVRIFEDSYPVDNQSYAALEHVDAYGTIDVKAVRDMSKKGYRADGSDDLTATLTGLYELSDAEFASRDLSDWTQTKTQSTATEGIEMTPAEKEAFYAPYANFGLSYDAASDILTYRGKRVRDFLDIKRSNGETFESGRFKGTMTHIGSDNGEVDVRTIRDFSKPDANGDGTLIGMSSEEVR